MKPVFPFDVIARVDMPGETGSLIRKVREHCMIPPFPWGHWLYGRLFRRRCAALEGDVIELGVGQGGTSLFFAHLARDVNKKMFSLDSFCGLPEPDKRRDNPFFIKGDYGDATDVSRSLLERFKDKVAKFGLDEVVVPLPGFFEDTLPTLDPDQRFCLVHVDCDLFGGVFCALEHLFDKVVDGGVIILDDFFHHAQGPLRAASEYFNSIELFPTLHVAFPYQVFFFKRQRYRRQRKRSLDGNFYSFEWLKKDRHFIETLETSIETSAHDQRAQDNCRMFLDLLRSRETESSEIYTYWRSLEAYWDQIFAGAAAQEPNRAAFTM